MQKNTFRSAPVRAYNVVAPDGKVVSSWDYREDAAEDLRDNKAAYPAGCRILTKLGLQRFKAHLAGEQEGARRNPSEAANLKGETMQTFREVHPKPRHLRDNQTMVVDNEGNYFIVSENTPIHQRLAGYKEVLVFPCDAMGEVDAWLEVGGRPYVGLSEFLADLLEGRETLDEALIEMVASASRRDAKEAFLAMAERHAKRRKAAGPTRADRLVQTFREVHPKPQHLRHNQTMVVDNEGNYFIVSENAPELANWLGGEGYKEVMVFPCDAMGKVDAWLEVGGRPYVGLSEFLADLLEGRETLDEARIAMAAREALRRRKAAGPTRADRLATKVRAALNRNPDEHRFAAKQIREQSRPYAFQLRSEPGNSASFQSHAEALARAYPFQLRSESGVNESFPSHAEALQWAESNLKKGEFFTVSKDSDHFHEHYVKE